MGAHIVKPQVYRSPNNSVVGAVISRSAKVVKVKFITVK